VRAGPLTALALVAIAVAALGISDTGGGATSPPGGMPTAGVPTRAATAGALEHSGGPLAELERAVDAAPRVARRATVTIGRSSEGRPVRAVAINGQGDGSRVLVVGCIHGTECAGIRIARLIYNGCPPEGDGVIVVPDLNPDGYSLETRLNARGVDLNRNFAAGWRAGGAPGDPEYPGTGPFSEPESRIARRLIRALRPDVTIWFHQQAEPLVRAWGPSIPAAREYAHLAGATFDRLPWLDGTAPNWENHRFAGTSSFVVELASGSPDAATVAAHATAAITLAKRLGGGA
jgi:protein MpaA